MFVYCLFFNDSQMFQQHFFPILTQTQTSWLYFNLGISRIHWFMTDHLTFRSENPLYNHHMQGFLQFRLQWGLCSLHPLGSRTESPYGACFFPGSWVWKCGIADMRSLNASAWTQYTVTFVTFQWAKQITKPAQNRKHGDIDSASLWTESVVVLLPRMGRKNGQISQSITAGK